MVASDWIQLPIIAVTFKLQNMGVAMVSTQTASATFVYYST